MMWQCDLLISDSMHSELPDALLTGPVPSTDRFVTSLNVSDPDAEITRRRDCGDAAIRIVNSSIGRALREVCPVSTCDGISEEVLSSFDEGRKA
uniref:Uncharacterized protein n=1 Tax=Caenorhabditis japonica TaxID=281687 RepID=A0A8R1E8Y5_CAEJA